MTYKTLVITGLISSLAILAWAGDLGPRDSTAPGTLPAIQTGAPAAPASVPGPMDSETVNPVNKDEQKTIQTPAIPPTDPTNPLQIQIAAVEKKLNNPNLSKRRRNKLEKELTRLKVKQEVDTKP